MNHVDKLYLSKRVSIADVVRTAYIPDSTEWDPFKILMIVLIILLSFFVRFEFEWYSYISCLMHSNDATQIIMFDLFAHVMCTKEAAI